jgi:hypothetical protein
LIEANENDFINDAVVKYSRSRQVSATANMANAAAAVRTPSMRHSDGNVRPSHPDVSLKWSGTDFITSPTEEPWVSDIAVDMQSFVKYVALLAF